jgi:GT2 family glycosyltransferase
VIRSEENLGFSGGHYLTYKYNQDGDFDLLWILNNDLKINETSLPALIEAYQEHGEGIFGSISVKDDNETLEFGGTHKVNSYDVHPDFATMLNQGKKLSELKGEKTYWASTIFGFSMIIPIDVIKKYGYMDESFFMYYEEFEYSLRLLTKHKVRSFIVPKSVVMHEGASSFKKSKMLLYVQLYYMIRNQYLLGKLFFGHKKKSYLKDEFKHRSVFGFFTLLIPKNLVENFSPKRIIHHYFNSLAKYHFYINKTGKTIRPEKYL